MNTAIIVSSTNTTVRFFALKEVKSSVVDSLAGLAKDYSDAVKQRLGAPWTALKTQLDGVINDVAIKSNLIELVITSTTRNITALYANTTGSAQWVNYEADWHDATGKLSDVHLKAAVVFAVANAVRRNPVAPALKKEDVRDGWAQALIPVNELHASWTAKKGTTFPNGAKVVVLDATRSEAPLPLLEAVLGSPVLHGGEWWSTQGVVYSPEPALLQSVKVIPWNETQKILKYANEILAASLEPGSSKRKLVHAAFVRGKEADKEALEVEAKRKKLSVEEQLPERDIDTLDLRIQIPEKYATCNARLVLFIRKQNDEKNGWGAWHIPHGRTKSEKSEKIEEIVPVPVPYETALLDADNNYFVRLSYHHHAPFGVDSVFARLLKPKTAQTETSGIHPDSHVLPQTCPVLEYGANYQICVMVVPDTKRDILKNDTVLKNWLTQNLRDDTDERLRSFTPKRSVMVGPPALQETIKKGAMLDATRSVVDDMLELFKFGERCGDLKQARRWVLSADAVMETRIQVAAVDHAVAESQIRARNKCDNPQLQKRLAELLELRLAGLTIEDDAVDKTVVRTWNLGSGEAKGTEQRDVKRDEQFLLTTKRMEVKRDELLPLETEWLVLQEFEHAVTSCVGTPTVSIVRRVIEFAPATIVNPPKVSFKSMDGYSVSVEIGPIADKSKKIELLRSYSAIRVYAQDWAFRGHPRDTKVAKAQSKLEPQRLVAEVPLVDFLCGNFSVELTDDALAARNLPSNTLYSAALVLRYTREQHRIKATEMWQERSSVPVTIVGSRARVEIPRAPSFRLSAPLRSGGVMFFAEERAYARGVNERVWLRIEAAGRDPLEYWPNERGSITGEWLLLAPFGYGFVQGSFTSTAYILDRPTAFPPGTFFRYRVRRTNVPGEGKPEPKSDENDTVGTARFGLDLSNDSDEWNQEANGLYRFTVWVVTKRYRDASHVQRELVEECYLAKNLPQDIVGHEGRRLRLEVDHGAEGTVKRSTIENALKEAFSKKSLNAFAWLVSWATEPLVPQAQMPAASELQGVRMRILGISDREQIG